MGTRGKFPSAIRLANTALQYGEDSTSGMKSEPNLGRLHGDLCAGNQANSVGLNHLRCKAMRQPGKGSKEDEVAAVNGTVTDLLIFIYRFYSRCILLPLITFDAFLAAQNHRLAPKPATESIKRAGTDF